MRTRLSWVVLLAVMGLTPLEAAPSSRLETLTLENGLTVLVRKVTSAKDAAVVVLYPVGNRDDPEGRSGMASVIAALYHAAPTATTPARTPDSLIPRWPRGSRRALGWTAVAADDHTLLARTLPSDEVPAELADVADRMAGLKVGDQDLLQSVSSLRKRLENLEQGGFPVEAARIQARERIVSLPHAGRRPGRAEQVAEVSLEEVRERLKRHYIVSNAVLSVTGDVDVGALRQQIKKRFGALPRGEPLPKSPHPKAADPKAEEPPSQDPVSAEALELAGEGKETGAVLALRAPDPAATLEYAAYLVLAVRLYDAWYAAAAGGGAAAADAVGVPLDILRDAEALYLTWRAPAGSSLSAAETRLKGALTAALTKPVAAADVLRTRTSYNLHFGLPPLEGSWADEPQIVAHADARRAQLELDGEAVMKLVSTVTLKDLASVARRPTAIVVARPAK